MVRYLISFEQEVDAPDAGVAREMAFRNIWESPAGFRLKVYEGYTPSAPPQEEIDPSTGLRHWRGAEQ